MPPAHEALRSRRSVRLIEAPWAGKLRGGTLLFEALVLSLYREMPFAAVARLVSERWHRVAALEPRQLLDPGAGLTPLAGVL